MALPAYANNLPENASQWQTGVSTENSQSNAKFSIGATADNGANFGSTFKLQQKLQISADIQIAPEHVDKDGAVFIVVKYNDTWVMKSANGWENWDFTLDGLVANSAIHKLSEIESPVIQDDMTAFPGNFEVFLGYQVEGDLNYNQAPFNFTVGLSEDTPDLGVQSFYAAATELETSGTTLLHATVKNFGGKLSTNSQLFYYQRASNDNKENKLNTADTQACAQAIYPLPQGNGIEKNCQIDLPSIAGDYYYGVCIKKSEAESNLTNNCSETVKITVKNPVEITTPTLVAQADLTGFEDNEIKVLGGIGSLTKHAAGGSGSGEIIYSSSDESIATVNRAGLVTIHAIGITAISATKAADGTYLAQTAIYNLTVQPPMPTEVSITPGNSTLEVNWTAVTGAEEYTIYVSSSADQATPLTTGVSVTGTTAEINGLTNGQIYYVVVKTKTNSIESAASDEKVATPVM